MTDTIQEQMIALRRKHILEAAASVFAEKGFHPTTIKDIAREAGVADGTIYNYFKNKTDLLMGIMHQMKANALQDAAVIPMDAQEDIRGFLRTYLRHPLMALRGEHFALFRVVNAEVMVNAELRAVYYREILEPMIAGGEALFEQWAAAGLIQPVELKLRLRAVSAMMAGLITQNIMGDALLEAEWERLPEVLADMILDGMGKTN